MERGIGNGVGLRRPGVVVPPVGQRRRAQNGAAGAAGRQGADAVLCHAASDEGVGGDSSNSSSRSGSSFPEALAANRMCAIRDAGIPIDRQLWTVDVGASIILAVAVVPPR